jgi:hypothetical protein
MNRVEEINQRLSERNRCDPPPIYFSPRPVPTKYTILPVVDERAHQKVPIKALPVFDTSLHFLPGTSAPWSGKIDQIDTESSLLCTKKYVPSDDLYEINIPVTPSVQPFPLLFSHVRMKPTETTFKEKQLFHNDTRIKNIY